jgi:hypothetical protein
MSSLWPAIFGPEAENDDATHGIDNTLIFEPAAENNDAVSSSLQVDEVLVAAAENNDTALALDVHVESVAVSEVSCI